MLNRKHPDVAYNALGRTEIQAMGNEALASLDRETILEAKSILEFLNEQGCPL